MTRATTSPGKPLSWKPVLKGSVYCSPACGGGCTKQAYEKAKKDAFSTLKALKTKGWQMRVWENLGWYWCLTNRLCGLSIHHHNGLFHCMLAEQDATECSHGGMSFPRFGHFKNPNQAVSNALSKSKAVFQRWATGFENLNSI